MVRLCGNHDDAEDALVTALTAAYKALPRLRDEEAFRGWLAKIARRTCYRLKNRPEWAELIEGMAANPEEGTVAEAMVMRKCIYDAMESLAPALKQVYVARDVQQKPAEVVARELGLSIPAVKSRLHRARRAMRESLENSLCTDESFLAPAASG